jgi:hypothetical protein
MVGAVWLPPLQGTATRTGQPAARPPQTPSASQFRSMLKHSGRAVAWLKTF